MSKLKYEVTLCINEKELTSSGETFAKALSKIAPTFYKTKAILKVKLGDKTAERLLYIPIMRKIFSGNNTTRAVTVKRLESILKFQ